jgi:hypothetical protein
MGEIMAILEQMTCWVMENLGVILEAVFEKWWKTSE